MIERVVVLAIPLLTIDKPELSQGGQAERGAEAKADGQGQERRQRQVQQVAQQRQDGSGRPIAPGLRRVEATQHMHRQVRGQDRGKNERNQVAGKHQSAKGQAGGRQRGQPRTDHRLPKRPQAEGQENERDRFGQRGADVQVNQVIGDVDISHGGHQACAAASPACHEAVHGQAGGDDAQAEDQLDRCLPAKTEQVKSLTQVGCQRCVDNPKRIAVAKGKIGRPAREKDAILPGAVKLEEKVDVVAGIVRAPEVAGLGKRGEGRQRQQRQRRQGQQMAALHSESAS